MEYDFDEAMAKKFKYDEELAKYKKTLNELETKGLDELVKEKFLLEINLKNNEPLTGNIRYSTQLSMTSMIVSMLSFLFSLINVVDEYIIETYSLTYLLVALLIVLALMLLSLFITLGYKLFGVNKYQIIRLRLDLINEAIARKEREESSEIYKKYIAK